MIRLAKNSPQPYYLQVKEKLREAVREGKFMPGDPLPNEIELAAQLGLSRMTVRRAIMELTAEGLFQRIRGRGTFLKPPLNAVAAVAPRNTESGLIGVVAPFDKQDIASFYFARVLNAVESACNEHAGVLLRKTKGTPSEFVSVLRRESNLSGLIVLCMKDRAWMDALASAEIPVVFYDCNRPTAKVSFDQIVYGNEDGARQATDALLDVGHREIALLIHDCADNEVFQARRRGYERSLSARGIPIQHELILDVEANGAHGYATMNALLNRKEGRVPTAVLCSTDEIAVGAIAAVKDHGWRIPEQISIVGMGDAGYFCSPALSTVRIEVDVSVRAAVKCLLERIAEPRLPSRTVEISMTFIPRASSGVARPL
ncbi:MAG TPA: GntR family transcriptional regulator [Planctomycetota bacterium]|nr:GntR family transcriptional regulator [Planctomycetota bacterium]